MTSSSLTASRTSYPKLVAAIKTEIAAGRKIIQQTQAETYWKVGRFISDYILEGKDRAGYGEETYRRLSKDLNIHKRNLLRAVQFSREFTIVTARSQLTWTHFRELLALPNGKHRRALVQKALKRRLSTRQLQDEINKRRPAPVAGAIPRLTASPGQFHTYTAVKGPDGKTYLDAGFDVWHDRPSAKPAAKHDYTFRARVESIVDGDTLWAAVDLGFDIFTRQKLRLRAIDCPEMSTPEGRRAKRFVQTVLKPGDSIVVRTLKSDDKYGRYLADVFIIPQHKLSDDKNIPRSGMWIGEGEKEMYLNQELLERRLAISVSI